MNVGALLLSIFLIGFGAVMIAFGIKAIVDPVGYIDWRMSVIVFLTIGAFFAGLGSIFVPHIRQSSRN